MTAVAVSLQCEILAALDTLTSRLSAAGARVGVAAPESFGDLRTHHALYRSILTAVTSGRVSSEERDRQARRSALTAVSERLHRLKQRNGA